MQFDFDVMSPAARFSFLTSADVPRPIALITTVSPGGTCNAAPYTFFSIAGTEPPMVTVTMLPTPDGRMKDPGTNILHSMEFMINLVSEKLAEDMNLTCIDAPADVDEMAMAGLASCPIRQDQAATSVSQPRGPRVRAPHHHPSECEPTHCSRAYRTCASQR